MASPFNFVEGFAVSEFNFVEGFAVLASLFLWLTPFEWLRRSRYAVSMAAPFDGLAPVSMASAFLASLFISFYVSNCLTSLRASPFLRRNELRL